MFALSRTWRLVSRRFTGTDAGPATGQPRSALELLGAAARTLLRYCRQVKEQWENLRYVHELASREAALVTKEARRSKRQALVLLLGQLNHEQRQEFRRYGHFHVRGGSSGNLYRIRVDTSANIDLLHADGTPKHRLCAGPADVPVYAMMAGQLLYLQDSASERRFLLRANVHPLYPVLSGNIP